MRALDTAATGLKAMQQNVDIIANNLSNVNTTGFKQSRALFQDLFYQQLRQPGLNTIVFNAKHLSCTAKP